MQKTKHFPHIINHLVRPVCIYHSVLAITEEIIIACVISSALCLTISSNPSLLPLCKLIPQPFSHHPSHLAVDDLPPPLPPPHTVHASVTESIAMYFNYLIICLSSLYYELFEGSMSPSHRFILGVWHTVILNTYSISV